MKYEAAETVSKTSRHVRSVEIEEDRGQEKDEKFDSLLKTLEKLSNSLVSRKKTVPRRSLNVTCWKSLRTERREKWTLLGRIYLWNPEFNVGGHRCQCDSVKNRLGPEIEGEIYLHSS
ncbi:hypothetical protein AVEN_144776-1 [Araneus ventricosus]|uniref:Uncharacterized protein n=1 Tax=Araneus ventricosus TaxID=182803 RepID=A0A4Y2WA83_ARAVE|nr:hypothetical protein AVEN_144776-1 [Araneus ventricosus]